MLLLYYSLSILRLFYSLYALSPDKQLHSSPSYFLGGVQLISLGIIGEYFGDAIYDEVKGRPLYLIDKKMGASRVPKKIVILTPDLPIALYYRG